MAILKNVESRGFGFPKVGDMPAFLLAPGEAKEVPDAYLEGLRSAKRPDGRARYAGTLARIERGDVRIIHARAPSPAANDGAGDKPPETLVGIAVPKAGPMIAEEVDLDVLARWREADDRSTIHRLIDERLEELADEE